MVNNSIAAGEFKAKCLALLDEIAQTGKSLVITKRGKAVAKLVPVDDPTPIEGSVTYCDDLIAPAIDEGDWAMLRCKR